MVTAMTIAGSDPTSGAGIGADLKTFIAIGVNPVNVITCLTAQNDEEFSDINTVDASFVTKQAETILSLYKVSAVKIGMVYTKENVKAVSELITHHGLKNVVLDPLLVSSTGKSLADFDVSHLKTVLFPHIDVLTPNVSETEKIVGKNIVKIDDLKEAASEIEEFGCDNIVITGFKHENNMIDLLYDGEDFIELKAKEIEDAVLHGTGCTFSSAITAFLAEGKTLKEAVKEAKEFTHNAIRYAHELSSGRRVLNHFFLHNM